MLAAIRSSARPKLVADSGFDGQARAALAIAIEEKRVADETHRKLASAGESLRIAAFDADRAAEAARQAVEDAKAATVSHLTAVATGSAGKAPKTVKAARAELAEAEEALELARAARDGLTGRIDEAKATADRMVDRVRDAALDVLRESPIARSLVVELDVLQKRMLEMADALEWLISRRIIATKTPSQTDIHSPEADYARAVNYRRGAPPSAWRNLGLVANGRQVWDDALAALMQDANAPLPGADR
ncbi:MAG: hypothetical protein HIU92_02585 [Proteobacteria bacterium]|nr:hypothetical protein [Pseudomonadota bacterium]